MLNGWRRAWWTMLAAVMYIKTDVRRLAMAGPDPPPCRTTSHRCRSGATRATAGGRGEALRSLEVALEAT
eukprot:SAG22_NODE_4925_length_1130_cov_0.990301_1_plen_69_part_10